MRLIHTYVDNEPRWYRCYDNHKDFLKDQYVYGYKLTDICNPKEGCYVLTYNGWYVPIIRVNSYDAKVNNAAIYKITIPRNTCTIYINHSRMPRKSSQFVFYPDRQPKITMSKPKYVAVIYLMKKGMPIYDAVQYVFPKLEEKKVLQLINMLLNTEDVLQLIKDQTMSKLKDELKEQGIDQTWYVNQLKKILDDPDANANLKKHALEVIGNTLEKEERKPHIGISAHYVTNEPPFLPNQKPIMLEEKKV